MVVDQLLLDHLLKEEANKAAVDLAAMRQAIVLRRRYDRDGNRRRLFVAFDSLFTDGAHAPMAAEAGVSGSGALHLTGIRLQNWKVFEHLSLDFPAFRADRSVVLIGGQNGYGKTSLLEALIACLFGKRAVLNLIRPDAASRNQAYRATIERAFNRRARDRQDGAMTIVTDWETADGPLRVERRWYFNDDGTLLPEDESLTLWTGEDQVLLDCPDGSNSLEYFQGEIERRLLTPSLGAFLFFDGEQVQRFAEAAFSEQVRAAVEGVSGLAVWRRAVGDLRDYARDRSRAGEKSEASGQDLAVRGHIEQDLTALLQKLSLARARREAPERDRDRLLGEIATLERSSFADQHEILERRQANAADQVRARHDLASMATQTLPLLLAGRTAEQLATQLASETGAGAADSGIFRNEDALELLLSRLRQAGTGFDQEDCLRQVWNELGEGTANTPALHAYLSYRLRNQLIEKIGKGADHGLLRQSAGRLDDLVAEAGVLSEAVAAQRSQDTHLQAARADLNAVHRQLSELDVEIRIFEERIESRKAEIAALDERCDADAQWTGGEQVSAALTLADQVEAIIEAVLPRYYRLLGSAMTEAYLALAHKGIVERIEIDSEGHVALLDSHGADIRSFDASAGESQIFAMALMASVSRLAGDRLPLVIDTPLGRLDPEHRRRILSYFTNQARQTILLSQPDEVTGAYLDMIAPRVAASFRLEHRSVDGRPGGSAALPGYFETVAA
jgi:DNA sulfur modification protein DndD